MSNAASRNVIDAKRGSEKDARLSISASSASSACPSTPVGHVSSAMIHPSLPSPPCACPQSRVFTLSEIASLRTVLPTPIPTLSLPSVLHLGYLSCRVPASPLTSLPHSFSLHTSFQPFRFLSFPFLKTYLNPALPPCSQTLSEYIAASDLADASQSPRSEVLGSFTACSTEQTPLPCALYLPSLLSAPPITTPHTSSTSLHLSRSLFSFIPSSFIHIVNHTLLRPLCLSFGPFFSFIYTLSASSAAVPPFVAF